MNTSEVVIEPWPRFSDYWSVELHGKNTGCIQRVGHPQQINIAHYRFGGVHDFYRLDAYAQQLVTKAANDFIALQKITDRMLA